MEVWLHALLISSLNFYSQGKNYRHPLHCRLRGPRSRSARHAEEKYFFLSLQGIDPQVYGSPTLSLVAIPTELSLLL
jgi:hypothetical protein